MKNLLEDFQPVSKAEWLAKMEKDLKGKPLSDLQWHISETVSTPPFYHPEDMNSPAVALLKGRTSNEWAIGEYINVEAPEDAHAALMEGLNGGVEAPLFRLYQPLNEAGIELLLSGVAPEMVALNFGEYYTNKAPEALFHTFANWLNKQKAPLENIAGSIDFDPLLDWSEPPIQLLAQLMRNCIEKMPLFRPLQVNAKTFHGGPEQVVDELAMTLAKGNAYLNALKAEGINSQAANAHLQFGLAISKSYFVEIAKLRAFRLLWANILKGHGSSGQPFITAHFAHESQDDNVNTNIIRASTQAMSAVIGGIDRLYVLPSNHVTGEPDQSFGRRIARNVQHLLKMESHLHRVIDPGAGSFLIEKLTAQLAGQAWARFQELDQQEAFGF